MADRPIPFFKRFFNLYILSIIFNLVNLSVYAVIFAASVLKFLVLEQNVIVISSFSGVACLLLIFSEFHISQMVYDYFRFIVTFRGRGALLLILAFIVFETEFFNLIATYYTVSVALLYVVISFVPHILPLNDIKTNLRSYSAYMEELRDPYGMTYNVDMMSNASRPHENGLSTIRTNAVRDVHTIRSGPENVSKQEPNIERIRSGREFPHKGQATLAMEINAALSEINYSDFAAASSGNLASASLEQDQLIPPRHRSILVGSPLTSNPQTPESNPLGHHFVPIFDKSNFETDNEFLSRNDSSASSHNSPPIPPPRNPQLHRNPRV